MQPWFDVPAKPGFQAALHNLGWMIAEKLVRLVASVVVGLLVARYLGPEQFGSLSFCLAVVTLLGVLPALGLEGVVQRELIRRPGNAAELLTAAFRLRLVAGLVALVFLLIAALLAGNRLTGVERSLLAIMSPLLLQPALFVPDIWLQANLRAKAATRAQVGALLVAAVARLGLILLQAPLLAFGVVMIFEMMLVAAGLRRALASAGPPALADQDSTRKLMGSLVREAWPLLLTSLAVIVYMKIDEVMLRQMAGPAAVGVYAAAVRISELWYFLPVALASSVLPSLLRTRERDAVLYRERLQQFFDLNAGLAYGLAIPLALVSGWVTRLAYGEAFAAAGPVLAVHIWASLFVFLGVARGQWLVNEGHTRFYFLATLAGAIVNVLLNLLLIPRQGALGAAWATLIAYGLAAWLTSFAYGRAREVAWMQTRAILLPILGWRYLFRG